MSDQTPTDVTIGPEIGRLQPIIDADPRTGKKVAVVVTFHEVIE